MATRQRRQDPPRRTGLPLIVLVAGLVVAAGDLSAAFFPPFFDHEEVFTGHPKLTAIRFAPNGNVFVAQKSGQIYAYEDLSDTTKTLVIDLSLKVHGFWDRGLLGLAVDPGYPLTPYIYVLYAFDAFEDGTYPRWGPGGSPTAEDPCPNPPGATGDGCVVYGLLSRVQVNPLTLQAIELPVSGIVGPDEPLLSSNWCQQYPSHSIGDLVFGGDGYLYVSAGDGASFGFADWGQNGTPQNPCDDPPDGIATGSVPNPNDGIDGEGGALRSQDILTPSDRTDLNIPGRPDYVDEATFDGTLLRIDVSSVPVQAPPDNPLVTLNTVPDDDFIVAMGLRNPFRINKRPGTNEIWITDVGWGRWEEVNRVADPVGTVENFGWPCYEGDNSISSIQNSYDQQDMCQALYADNIPLGINTVAPHYAYHHNSQVVPGEVCGTGSSAATGVTFNNATVYPPAYEDALFFADSSRNCVWTMFADGTGLPDKTDRLALVSAAGGRVVDIQMGPDGHLYYANYDAGKVLRVIYTNDQPVVTVTEPTDGAGFVEDDSIDFVGTASDTEDGSLTANLTWVSDLDGQIGTGGAFSVVLTLGTHMITASVEDSEQQVGSQEITVTVDPNAPPTVEITAPANGSNFIEDTSIDFSGTADDLEDGDLTSTLSWASDLDGPIGAGGSFSATLSVGTHTVTAEVTDSHGETTSSSITVTVDPNTPPTVTITAPTDGSNFIEATSIGFTGTASDTEDGNLTSSLSWSSNLDGSIGAGGLFSKVLSVGTHTITASVTDSHGDGDSDSITVTVNANTSPVVGITTPSNGASFVEETSIGFTGTASDTQDGDLSAALSWSSDLDGVIGAGGSFSKVLSVGTHLITASVSDSHGDPGSASITVTVTPNTPPTVSITAPANGSNFIEDTLINFTGTAGDNEDGDLSGSLTWSSNLDGAIGSGATPSAVLSVGDHIVTASVIDSHGETGSASITVTVDANTPPDVTITAPSDGSSFIEDALISFVGTATDNEDGILTSSLSWSSDRDGMLGTGGSFAKVLSVGVHSVTASATDSHGDIGSATISVTVEANTPPEVSITAPSDGTSVVEATSIDFAGSAIDTEDGDLTTTLSWTSSLDGAIGGGGSFSTVLTVGVHTVTATATDSHGDPGSDSITVTVTSNTAPTVVISLPADNSSFIEDSLIAFTGTASDIQDGDLSSTLDWTSSLDGLLGAGASFSKVLSVGTHTITAEATDSHDETGSTSITVTVTPNTPPTVSITNPVSGASFIEATNITFVGLATDTEDGDISADLSWASNLDGSIGGGASFSRTLSVGTHTVTASVVDGHGEPDTASITVTVTPNTPPSVTIGAPADGTSYLVASPIDFSGSASDVEDGDLTAGLEWLSNLDGVIGSGGAFSTALSVGSHTIVASVLDSHGVPASDSLTIAVTVTNAPPAITITAPADGSSHLEGPAITLTGIAIDTEDGDISTLLSWSSNLDGALGSGATVSRRLSIGFHTITATAIDSHGLPSSSSITIKVSTDLDMIFTDGFESGDLSAWSDSQP